MRVRLHILLVTFSVAFSPIAMADGLAPEELEIPKDIVSIATDPLASPDGSFPSPIRQPKTKEPTRSNLFYALPMVGFWLIFRRRGRGFRL